MKLAALLFALAACGGDPTGSVCPTTNAPTYAGFGMPFFTTYCLPCHSSTSTDRHGAPGDQNYDTEAQIRSHASDIDTEAASGPKATNTDMPDLSGSVHTAPTDDERTTLGQFLACEQASS
jgi:uncharacterized membrane protein